MPLRACQARWLVFVALVFLLPVFLSGCKKESLGDALVRGKVIRSNDKPMPLGFVQLYRGHDMIGQSRIGQDGSYLFAGVSPGAVTICISTSGPPPMVIPGRRRRVGPPPGVRPSAGPGGQRRSGGGSNRPPALTLERLPKEVQADIAKIEKKYGDPDSSDLTYDIRSGEQTFDIRLR